MLGLVPGTLDQGPAPSERFKQLDCPQKFPVPSSNSIWKPGDVFAPTNLPLNIIRRTAFLNDFGLSRLQDAWALRRSAATASRLLGTFYRRALW